MIVITGAAGFIGSCLSHYLYRNFDDSLMLVDHFCGRKTNNYDSLACKRMDRSEFIKWFEKTDEDIKWVLHLGARTDTTESNTQIFNELNLEYSKSIANICAVKNIPLIYASSAATYGNGTAGFSDELLATELNPLNPYGHSKNEFDAFMQAQNYENKWCGLKFFNVYGPNEYHKGRMASVIYHCFNQINSTKKMKLFRSHHPDFEDGQQMRDFIYVKDLIKVIEHLMHHPFKNGIYNLGTGKARSFLNLTHLTFEAMGLPANIEFIDTPVDIRQNYQYFTQANMNKLIQTGFDTAFSELETGIMDYVQHYLMDSFKNF